MISCLLFGKKNYYDGLNELLTQLCTLLQESTVHRKDMLTADSKRKIPVGMIILGIILLIIFSRRNRGGGGGFMSRRGYRGGFGPFIFPTGGGSWGGGGFGGGGFGGGGFGGFGGGSSGGGGASGSW